MESLGATAKSLQRVMLELRKVPGITAVAIIRRDGIVVDDILPRSVDSEKIGAMTAAIVGTAEAASDELRQGKFRRSIVDLVGSKIVSLGAGGEALLVALTKPDVNLGLVLIEMEEHATRVGGIFESG